MGQAGVLGAGRCMQGRRRRADGHISGRRRALWPRRTSPLPSAPPSFFRSARSRFRPSSMPAGDGMGQAAHRPASELTAGHYRGVRRPAGLGPAPLVFGLAYSSQEAIEAVKAPSRLASHNGERPSHLKRCGRRPGRHSGTFARRRWVSGGRTEPRQGHSRPPLRQTSGLGAHYSAGAGRPRLLVGTQI